MLLDTCVTYVTGCSTTFRSMPELVDVTLVRGSTYADFRRSYQINVDGEVRGAIRRNGRVAFQVPQGDHVLSLAIDWCGSNRIPFRATTGSNLKFECGTRL
jgi:hypothetical protein